MNITIRDGNTKIDVTAIFGHPTYWPRRLYANPWQFGLEHIDDADAASLLRGHLMEMAAKVRVEVSQELGDGWTIVDFGLADKVTADHGHPTPLAAYVAWATQKAKEQA
jgi:hypothetical protein